MSYYNELKKLREIDLEACFEKVTDEEILSSINKERLTKNDFINLISPKASKYIEEMAKKANEVTIQNFGKTIQVYLPLYISNFCSNECAYCGFSTKNKINRKKLSLEEIEEEAKEISKTGVKHILVLTGEAQFHTPIEYILDSITILKKYFESISIEMFPMDEADYKKLKECGVDGITIYQETYDEEIYDEVHIAGNKKDYLYRLETAERALKAGFRTASIGALYGLGEIKKEAFLCAMHAKYLMDNYLDGEISVSLPRINMAEGGFRPNHIMNDRCFVQIMTAFRLFLPRAGINISTRESAEFRDNILFLGPTKYSAGSKTNVGSYANENESTVQFEICDGRSFDEVIKMIRRQGYEVVFKDWELIV